MVGLAFVRQFAQGQKIDLDVADQEIVLHYALTLLSEGGLVGRTENGDPGPLLFKGGTALRKCVFGSTGRFSQDIDLDASHTNGFEAEIERLFGDHSPYHGIELTIAGFRYSTDGNFSGTVEYEHADESGAFELQISYRLDPILEPRDLTLQDQPYFSKLDCPVPVLYGLDAYEMIGEKIMACNRRLGGSSKDVYDLYLWSQQPFNADLVRTVAGLKAWTDRRAQPRYEPEKFLAQIQPKNFRWMDISRLVPRKLSDNKDEICDRVRQRFAFLAECSEEEAALLSDQTSHREHALFDQLRGEARDLANRVAR